MQASVEGFAGQVNVVILGSNDHRIISSMHPSFVNGALAQFKFKLEQLLEKMLSIKQSTVILVASVLPKQFVNPRVQSVARHVVRWDTFIVFRKYNFLLFDRSKPQVKLLSIDFGNWLFKDFVHLNYQGNNKLMESILCALKMLPDSIFLPATPVAPFDISDISQFPPLCAKRPAPDNIDRNVKCPRISDQQNEIMTDSPLVSGCSDSREGKIDGKYEEELCKLKEELSEAKKAIKDLESAQEKKDEYVKRDVEELKAAVMVLQSRKGNDLEIVESYKNQLARIDKGCLEVLESFKERLVKVEQNVNNNKNVNSEETGDIETNKECVQSPNTCAVQ